jgi:hypothetical protein
MNLTETATLLSFCAAIDLRTIGDTDVQAWQSTLPDVHLCEAMEAAREHYRADTRRLMPADVVQWTRRWRERVLQASPTTCPDVDPNDHRAYADALRQQTKDTLDAARAAQFGVPLRVLR